MPSERSKLGDWGEDAAGEFLERRGFRILERKYRCKWGEVDLVARDGPDLVFVEVRTRRSQSYGAVGESITAAKARRLMATCHHYLQRNGLTAARNGAKGISTSEAGWRIDLVSVWPVRGKAPRIHHLRNAVEYTYG